MRYVIAGPKTTGQWGPTYYIDRGGMVTTNAKRAQVYDSPDHAEEDLRYFRDSTRGYDWGLERLPPGLSVYMAVLKASRLEV